MNNYEALPPPDFVLIEKSAGIKWNLTAYNKGTLIKTVPYFASML